MILVLAATTRYSIGLRPEKKIELNLACERGSGVRCGLPGTLRRTQAGERAEVADEMSLVIITTCRSQLRPVHLLWPSDKTQCRLKIAESYK
jgi:hypothetical protein